MQIFIALGNLGKDPEVKYSQSGTAVCNVSLATNKKWADKSTGELREKTEWHRLVAFGNQAEALGKYCHKGSQIFVQGELQTRKWTDKEGIDRYTTEVVVRTIKFTGSRADNGQRNNGEQAQQQASSNASDSQPNQPAQQARSEPEPEPEFDDDDIPF